jgi:hypothetical protein
VVWPTVQFFPHTCIHFASLVTDSTFLSIDHSLSPVLPCFSHFSLHCLDWPVLEGIWDLQTFVRADNWITARSVCTCAGQRNWQVTKRKAKAVPLHAMKALWGRRCIAPTHSWPRTRSGEWSASRPGRALPRERTPVPIGQEAGWTSEPVWTQRLEENIFACVGDRTSIARSSSLYPYTILRYPGSLRHVRTA